MGLAARLAGGLVQALTNSTLAGVPPSVCAQPLRGQRQGGEPDQSGAKDPQTHHGNYLYVAQEGKFSRYNHHEPEAPAREDQGWLSLAGASG